MSITLIARGGVPLVLASTMLLAGCVAAVDTSDAVAVDDVPSSIPADELASTAEQVALQNDADVVFDCGTGDVDFVVGATVECIATDAASGETLELTVEITAIEGGAYQIRITGDGGGAPEPEPQGDSAFVSSADFGEVVANALEPVIGERPAVLCGQDDIEIVVGAELTCPVVLASGFGEARVVIVAFDGSTYEITAELIDE